jgi:alpha-ketoglutarate-dependent taurine dioxygenase
VAIEGMARDESDALLELLFDHMEQDRYVYDHRWSVGDLVVNDNCSTIHKGTPNYRYPRRRLVYRTIVKGSVPY